MSGYLVITPSEFRDSDDDLDSQKQGFSMWDKEQISRINQRNLKNVMRMGRRHNLMSYEKMNYVQLKIEKPILENYEKILNNRLPCLPRYYYWYETQFNYLLLRVYYPVRFSQAFEKAKTFDQMLLLYSLICIVEELHHRGIFIGLALTEACFVDEKRVIVQPEQNSTK